MDLESSFDELKKMRFLGEDDSIDVFEDILSEICENGDLVVIKELCSIFEDDIDFPSASESIMKCILYICHKYGEEEGMYELVTNMNRMFPQGKKCAIKLIRMVLNSESFIQPFVHAIKKAESDAKNQIVKILTEIKDINSDMYKEKVDFVLQSI